MLHELNAVLPLFQRDNLRLRHTECAKNTFQLLAVQLFQVVLVLSCDLFDLSLESGVDLCIDQDGNVVVVVIAAGLDGAALDGAVVVGYIQSVHFQNSDELR